MRLKLLFFILLGCLFQKTFAQVMLSNSTPVTIDFSATTPATVGTSPGSAFAGNGFSPAPTISGRLNSNAWSVRGFDFGTLAFGGTQTVDDFGRGSVISPVLTPGLYAYTDSPGSVANPVLMIQSGPAGDFNPGSLVLRVKNNGTSNLTQLEVSYNIYMRNDEGRSSSFNFSHSLDDVTYQDEPSLDFVSPDVADAFQWGQVGVTPTKSIIITGLNIAPGAFYYLRWSIEDVAGTGDRDEFGLDDIVITGSYGAPAPEINVQNVGGVTVLSGDTTPSVAESTDFAPIGSPISTNAATLSTTFKIQNLGGAVLNVSSVVITGTNAANFTVYTGGGSNPVGSIAAVSGSVISTRELTIIFDPSIEGLHTARVNIYNTDSNENPYWFDIRGYGFVPKPDINVKGLTGGTSNISSGNMIPSTFNNTLWPVAGTVVGSSVVKDYRIQNTGNVGALLQLTGVPIVSISGANPGDFVVTTQPTATSINAGFGTNFYITFTPTAVGIRTAIVTILNNDTVNDPFTSLPENPYTFLIQGTGVSPEADVFGNNQPIVSGSTLPTLVNHTFFDYLNITGATLTRTYTIKNTGNVALTVGTPTITGPNAADFVILTPPAASVAINGTTTFTVRFDPSATGVRDAVINFTNNDFNENPYTFAVRGYGIDYTPCSYLPVETIAIQDFETAPATPTWAYTTSGSTVAGGTAFGASGDSGASARYVGARSLQVNNATSTTTFGSINTSAYSDVELSVRVASLSTTTAEGSDSTDRILISVSSNGGTNWSDEVELVGNTNSKWSFTSGTGTLSRTYDGDNLVSSVSTPSVGYVTVDGNSTIRLSSLPKSTALQVRISILNNNAAEIWAIDDVSLFGRKEVTTTWTSSWSNGTPTTSVKAIIAGNYSTAANGNVQACKIQVNAGSTLTINSGQFISVESDLDNAGSIVIENGGSLVQKNDYATNSGNIVVKRNTTPVRRYDYTYWSSPVANQTLFNLSPLTLSDKFYQFNTAANTWQGVPPVTTVMVPGKGYIVRAPQTFDIVTPQVYMAQFSGPANNGFITQPVVNTIGTWNLLGNPYASSIDADKFLQLTSNNIIGGTLYFWTHNTAMTNNAYTNSDYASYNLLGGSGTASAANIGVNNTIPSGDIASGQGFFVVANTPGTVTFNNSMRQTTSNLQFYRHAAITASSVGDDIVVAAKHRLWLDLAGADGLFRQVLLGYADGATNDVDRDYDGAIYSVNTSLSFYSLLNAEKMVIEGHGLPFSTQDKFLLGYQASISGQYSISIEGMDGLFENQDVYLKDNLLQIEHDIKASPYSFTTEVGTFDNRFEIVYTTQALGQPEFDQSGLQIAVKDQVISIRNSQEIASVTIYDITGRQLFQKSGLNTTDYSIDTLAAQQQALMVNIELADGTKVTKKILF
ncbi:choice-of-anchor D domain-containing protein [Flavobacterium silvaticum]|uniref:Choice-of-anchor D domain-containing protein n=1 Tax=Flavobacterium silvaticum TaxID=1852020 RepID=A0A972JGH5_9FLAO|nr:choice-of-anchor D domain-containing protein [Flavobacterium silvaticum]NMH28211.1 choice-of-anchor D domain-containing protein [Flavobacterium silvaticum]